MKQSDYDEAAMMAFGFLCERIVSVLPPARRWTFTCRIVKGKVVTNRPEIQKELDAAWMACQPTPEEIRKNEKYAMAVRRLRKAFDRSIEEDLVKVLGAQQGGGDKTPS